MIEQPSGLHGNDAPEMIDVIGILEAVAYKVGALTDDCLADFARALAGNDQGQAELTPFLRDPLVGKPGKAMATIFIGPGWPSIVVSFFENQNPGVFVAGRGRQSLSRLQEDAADDGAGIGKHLVAQHREVENGNLWSRHGTQPKAREPG